MKMVSSGLIIIEPDHRQLQQKKHPKNRIKTAKPSSRMNDRSPSEELKSNLQYVTDLVTNVIDEAFKQIQNNNSVVVRGKQLNRTERDQRNSHRTTSIIIQDWDEHAKVPSECINVFALTRSVSERIVRGPNQATHVGPVSFGLECKKPTKEKPKKRLTFNSIFHLNKKTKEPQGKSEEDAESYDEFPSSSLPNFKKNSLSKSRKYASALELSSKEVTQKVEKPSIFRKFLHIGDNSSSSSGGFLKRSLSFRDVRKKEKTPTRDLTETKTQQWRQSLQSLVESDLDVSYKDLSFINYDVRNDISYLEPVSLRAGGGYIGRTQSMREKGSPQVKHPPYLRHTSVTPDCSNNSFESIPDLRSPTVSLPSLTKESSVDNVEAPLNDNEGGRTRELSESQDGTISFRSSTQSINNSGTGTYVKLKRHNATRQKVRHPATFVAERPRKKAVDEKVRSRSLNHLDSLEMRQAVVGTADNALKDSRSEPDCTKPLLPPPAIPSREPEPDGGSGKVAPRKHMLSRSQMSLLLEN